MPGTSSRETFDALPTWLDELEAYAAPDLVRVVVGNKTDKPGRQVSEAEAQAFAESKGATYLEATAKQHRRVQQMFDAIVDEVRAHRFSGRACVCACGKRCRSHRPDRFRFARLYSRRRCFTLQPAIPRNLEEDLQTLPSCRADSTLAALTQLRELAPVEPPSADIVL